MKFNKPTPEQVEQLAKNFPHVLIAIGFLSGYECYMDLTLEEAKGRYRISEESDPEDYNIIALGFKDTFSAYDIWGAE